MKLELLNWATPFKIHTPPVENFGKYLTGGCEFSNTLTCFVRILWNMLIAQGVNILFGKELIYLKFTLPPVVRVS